MEFVHFHSQPYEVGQCLIQPGLLTYAAVSIELPPTTGTCHLNAMISYGAILTPYHETPRFARLVRSFYFGHAPIEPQDLTAHELIRGVDIYVESAQVDHSTTTPPPKMVVGEFEPESSMYQIFAGLVVTAPGTLDGTKVRVVPPSITGTVFVP